MEECSGKLEVIHKTLPTLVNPEYGNFSKDSSTFSPPICTLVAICVGIDMPSPMNIIIFLATFLLTRSFFSCVRRISWPVLCQYSRECSCSGPTGGPLNSDFLGWYSSSVNTYGAEVSFGYLYGVAVLTQLKIKW